MQNLTKEEIILLAEKTRRVSILKKLLETDDEEILNIIKLNPIATEKMKEEIDCKTSIYSKMLKYSKQCKNLSKDELNEIIKNSDDEIVLNGIVLSEETSSDILEKIVDKTNDDYILECVLRHKNLSSDILNKIIEKYKINVFSLDDILKNENTTSENIEKIIDKINEDYLLEKIAKHKNANASILNKIVDKATNGTILNIIERNKNTSLETLCKIEQKHLEIKEIQLKRDIEFNKDKKMLLKNSIIESFKPILSISISLVFLIFFFLSFLSFISVNLFNANVSFNINPFFYVSVFLISCFFSSMFVLPSMYKINKAEYYLKKGWL